MPIVWYQFLFGLFYFSFAQAPTCKLTLSFRGYIIQIYSILQEYIFCLVFDFYFQIDLYTDFNRKNNIVYHFILNKHTYQQYARFEKLFSAILDHNLTFQNYLLMIIYDFYQSYFQFSYSHFQSRVPRNRCEGPNHIFR